MTQRSKNLLSTNCLLLYTGGFDGGKDVSEETMAYYASPFTGCLTAVYIDGFNLDFNTAEIGVNIAECGQS